jgi:hypothetical protein
MDLFAEAVPPTKEIGEAGVIDAMACVGAEPVPPPVPGRNARARFAKSAAATNAAAMNLTMLILGQT